ncbi:hypothetical protein EC973_009524 [Apophysomyces ossiformis]|uniref:Protein-serine/threonine kinase n=1 Tax=Apophysomyces ossiformis TaxID=679940 RepID=A0A8H7BP07_9FUNG|nr:hypothetical protein EC973_009524 [Apophysomyces ossiformis]
MTTSSFICKELSVRYTHLLRLLSTLNPDTLQSPIIRNVAHRYLYDICTVIHPSLCNTSNRAFKDVLHRLRYRQAASLIRLKYALLSTPTPASVSLMENLNTIGLGIHFLLDQHLAQQEEDRNKVQTVCPVEIARKAVIEARHTCATTLGIDMPVIDIQSNHADDHNNNNLKLTYIPNALHRILYESSLLVLQAAITGEQQQEEEAAAGKKGPARWIHRQWKRFSCNKRIVLDVFGGPTSVGFRINSPWSISAKHFLPDIPRDPLLGIPTCSSVLRHTEPNTISEDHQPNLEWEAWQGWRSAKAFASHWGGNLEAVSYPGLGSTLYLALDRDTSLLERYPSRVSLSTSSQGLLRHSRRISAAAAGMNTFTLNFQTAAAQLDAFLYAIGDPREPMHQPVPQYQDHSISLSVAVGHA